MDKTRALFEALSALSLYLFMTLLGIGRLGIIIILAAITVAAAAAQKKAHPIKRAFELWQIKKAPVRACVLCIFLGAATNVALGAAISLLPARLTAAYIANTAHLSSPDIFTLISAVLLAPVLEELVFRGAILEKLRHSLGAPIALALSAALFGFTHTGALWIAYASLCGILLGAVYIKFSSVIPCIILHAAFNATNYILALIPAAPSDLTLLLISAAVCIAAAIPLFKTKGLS
jgi:membrane protease YdiL (CAAX protease family)